jgi:hypothetical protein
VSVAVDKRSYIGECCTKFSVVGWRRTSQVVVMILAFVFFFFTKYEMCVIFFHEIVGILVQLGRVIFFVYASVKSGRDGSCNFLGRAPYWTVQIGSLCEWLG